MEQALAGVRVLDLTWYVAGPYATKLLADYGAEVIKVERPGEGDAARKMGPFPNDEPHLEKSALFLHLNTNKKSITLNLKTETGQKVINELVKRVDILVESFQPGIMARWGLDYETLARINPRLVMASITNFGQFGPYRDFKASDIVILAMGGDMYTNGVYEREPLKYGLNVALYMAGSSAAVGIMGAYYGAKYSGSGGQQVDISLMECLDSSTDRRTTNLVGYQYCGHQDIRASETSRGLIGGVFPCKDGYFALQGGGVLWPRTVRLLGAPELAKPPWGTPQSWADQKLKEELHTKWWLPWLAARTKLECWLAAEKEGLLSGPLNTTEEVLKDFHLKGRGVWKEVDHPAAGPFVYSGAPFIMDECPWQVKRPAPLLGQHNDEVYCELLGYSKQDLTLLRQQGVI